MSYIIFAKFLTQNCEVVGISNDRIWPYLDLFEYIDTIDLIICVELNFSGVCKINVMLNDRAFVTFWFFLNGSLAMIPKNGHGHITFDEETDEYLLLSAS